MARSKPAPIGAAHGAGGDALALRLPVLRESSANFLRQAAVDIGPDQFLESIFHLSVLALAAFQTIRGHEVAVLDRGEGLRVRAVGNAENVVEALLRQAVLRREC